MLIFRSSKRERYAKALRHMLEHPERYKVITRGRDYGADSIDCAAGCGWYITYTTPPA